MIIRSVNICQKAQMHRHFVAKYEPEVDAPAVKEWLYQKSFNEEFNLSFGYLWSDTCQLCDELKIAIPSATLSNKQDELCSSVNSKLVMHIRHFEKTRKNPNQTQTCL